MPQDIIALSDRIKELSHSTGTGNFTLDGAATGFSSFGSFYSYNDVLYYAITDGVNYEVGSGQYILDGSSNALTRFPFKSTNANAKVNFTGGVKEVYITYPGKYAVFTASGLGSFSKPKASGLAFWGSDQILDYNPNIVWDKTSSLLGISRSAPGYAIDVGGIPAYSTIRASGFIDGGSGILFSGVPGTYSGGRQLEPFLRNQLDNTTGTDAVFSLSGLVDQRLLFKTEQAGTVFAGPASGSCVGGCTPNYPTFRLLATGDMPNLSTFYVVQDNVPSPIVAGDVALFNTSGHIIYDNYFHFDINNNFLGVNTQTPVYQLDVNGSSRIATNLIVGNNIDVTGNLHVAGSLFVSGTQTFIDSTTVTIRDKQLELASLSGTAALSDTGIDDGGIVLKSTDGGDKKWTWRNATDSWTTNQKIDTSGIIFNGGTNGTISGAYQAGSGLSLHYGQQFNVGNMFSISDNAATSGFIHQGNLLKISGIVGIDTVFNPGTKLLTVSAGALSGWTDSTMTSRDNAISGWADSTMTSRDSAVSGWADSTMTSRDSAISGWNKAYTDSAIVGASGFNNWKITDGTIPTDDILNAETVTISGISGITTNYNATSNLLVIGANSLSGWADSTMTNRDNAISGWSQAYTDAAIVGVSGFSHWSITDGTVPIDNIVNAQTVTISGISGVTTGYNATTNLLTIAAVGLSGWADSTMTTRDSAVSGWNKAYTDSAVLNTYTNWKLSDGTTSLDGITNNQAVYISGVTGVDTSYDIANNIMKINGASLSGWTNARDLAISGYFQANLTGTTYSAGTGLALVGNTFNTSGIGVFTSLDFSNSIGSNPVRIGTLAGSGATSCNFTNIIGQNAGLQASGCDSTNMIGANVGTTAYQCDYTNMIGHQAGALSIGCSFSNMVGITAGYKANNCISSSMLGFWAGSEASGCNVSNMIGENAGKSSSLCSRTNMIGSGVGYLSSDCADTNMIGSIAGSGANSCLKTNMIGFFAGYAAGTCSSVNMIGDQAGYQASGSLNVNMIGVAAGRSTFNSPNSNMIGTQAGFLSTGCEYTNMIGVSAGQSAYNCSNTNMIGLLAGFSANNSSYSVFIGNNAGYASSAPSQILIKNTADQNTNWGYLNRTQAGILSIGDTITGETYNNKYIRIGATGTLTEIDDATLTVKSLSASRSTLKLVSQTSQSADQLVSTTNGGGSEYTIINKNGLPCVPVFGVLPSASDNPNALCRVANVLYVSNGVSWLALN